MANSLPSVVRNVTDQLVALREHVQTLSEIIESMLSTDQVNLKTQSHVMQILDTMKRDLRQLMDLKREDGFFPAIIENAPQLQHSVQQVEKDYDQLCDDLTAISEELINEGHGLKTRRHLHGWLSRFSALDRRECDLLQKVWTVDEGSLD